MESGDSRGCPGECRRPHCSRSQGKRADRLETTSSLHKQEVAYRLEWRGVCVCGGEWKASQRSHCLGLGGLFASAHREGWENAGVTGGHFHHQIYFFFISSPYQMFGSSKRKEKRTRQFSPAMFIVIFKSQPACAESFQSAYGTHEVQLSSRPPEQIADKEPTLVLPAGPRGSERVRLALLKLFVTTSRRRGCKISCM